MPVDDVNRRRSPADFRMTNLNTAEPSMTELLCKFLQQDAAPEVNVEVFSANQLNFTYFTSVFKELVETKWIILRDT